MRAMGLVRNATVVAVLGLLTVGCQNKLHEENKALWAQNQELHARYAELANQPKSDPQQLSQLQGQIAERDARIADLQNQLRQPAAGQANDPQIRRMLFLTSCVGRRDSLVFSEFLDTLACRSLAARSISDFWGSYLAT